MKYNSDEYDNNKNKILEENEYSKKKHIEIEERYKDLVNKKPLSVDLEESLAILHAAYVKKSKASEIGDEVGASINDFNSEENMSNSSDKFEDIEKSKTLDESHEEKYDTSDEKKDNKINYSVKFPDDGKFKDFYEENIAPMLERPDFKDIREFINAEKDFSDEKYEMLARAFEEKTGVSYSNIGTVVEENHTDDYSEAERELSFYDFKEGAKKVHAVPLENELKTRLKEDPLGGFLLGGALSCIVLLIVIYVMYSIW